MNNPSSSASSSSTSQSLLSYYLPSSSSAFSVDYVQQPALRLLNTPHIFFLPSALKHFVKVFTDCFKILLYLNRLFQIAFL
jgi:hypothetical protein